MGTKRRTSSIIYPKKARTISFVGMEGYEVLEFFDAEGEKFDYGKSGLAIELIKIYREAIDTYGREGALAKIRFHIEKDRKKIKSRK